MQIWRHDGGVARRTFLRDCARCVAAAVLGTLGVALAGRSDRNRGQGDTCNRRGFCRQCESRQWCVLPQALSYRRVMGADAVTPACRGSAVSGGGQTGKASD